MELIQKAVHKHLSMFQSKKKKINSRINIRKEHSISLPWQTSSNQIQSSFSFRLNKHNNNKKKNHMKQETWNNLPGLKATKEADGVKDALNK